MVISLIIYEVFTSVLGKKLKFIPDDSISNCEGKPLKAEETLIGELMDSDVKYVLEDDKSIKMVGGLHIKHEIKSPLQLKIAGEHKIRGEWIARIHRVHVDACTDLFNPTDIYYKFFKDHPRCPWMPGVSKKNLCFM